MFLGVIFGYVGEYVLYLVCVFVVWGVLVVIFVFVEICKMGDGVDDIG